MKKRFQLGIRRIRGRSTHSTNPREQAGRQPTLISARRIVYVIAAGLPHQVTQWGYANVNFERVVTFGETVILGVPWTGFTKRGRCANVSFCR
jgi:hypothetical protein